uniref:Atlastin-2-like n=2 Tax=Ciona intestinalis TaxID=7719 RepID=F7AMS6_CIOIN
MLENDHGQKVAVFLMDTQGSFDKGMTAAECSFIAALSTSLSSVQIYNLKGGLIDESDLQLLQIFLNHARAIIETEQGEENDRTSQFQCLLFLIRNWQMPDYDYGSKGGLEYLEEVMNTDQAENKDVRKKIRESFADVRCHLLEHPGKKVAKLKDSKLDKIKVLDIDKDFLEGVDDLAKCLFSKDSLVVKKLNGKACTGKDLMKVAK